MVELASPRVVYMVIQWGCLAKCQGSRKGGPNFQLVRLFERKFYQFFFFPPPSSKYIGNGRVFSRENAAKPIRADFTPISFHETEMRTIGRFNRNRVQR